MLTLKKINHTYDQAIQATVAHAHAVEAEALAKLKLDSAVAEGLLTGVVDGKNEQTRMAKARELYAPLFEAHEETARLTQLAKLDLDVAKFEMERIRTLLRLREMNYLQALRMVH